MAVITAKTAARQLRLLPAAVVKHVASGMTKHAERVMTESKAKYVPVDLGILRNSGHVSVIRSDSNGIELLLAYGGPAKAYAKIQHDRVRYLKIPFDKAIPRGKKVISSSVGQARRSLGL